VASGLGNALLLALVAAAIAPAPPPDPTPPETRLDIAAYRVPRAEAEARPPPADPGSEAEHAAARLGSTSVPRSEATSVTPAGSAARSETPAPLALDESRAAPATQRLPEAPPGGTALSAADVPEAAAAPAAPERAEQAANLAPAAETASAAEVAAQAASPAPPRPEAGIAAAAGTVAEDARAAQPGAEAARPAAQRTASARQSEPRITSVQPAVDPVERVDAGRAAGREATQAALPEAPRLAAREMESVNPAPVPATTGSAQPVSLNAGALPTQAMQAEAAIARPVTSRPAAATPQPPATAGLPARQAQGERILSAALPAASTPAAEARAAPAAGARPPTAGLDPVQPENQSAEPSGPQTAAAESTPPAATAASPAAPQAPAVASSLPEAAPAGRTASARLATTLGPSAPPSDSASAVLAWSGGGQESVDSASLAAISAFMRPGAARAEGDPLRDGIEGALGAVGCARLQAVFQPESGTLALRGHVPEPAAAAPVRDALRARLGDSIPIDDRVLVLPRPQCDMLDAVARVGLPQSAEQFTDPRIIGQEAHVREYRYAEGERLVLDLEAPDYPSYVYVDYFDAAGRVIHLQPNETVPLERLAPKTQVEIGAPRPDRPSLDIRIAPPFGQEFAVAFASSRPLFDAPRPMVEPALPYLEALRASISAARADDPDYRGEWVYFFVTTGPG
jgi:hypothetical protein